MFVKLPILALLMLFADNTPTRVAITFTGGHDTDPRDHGRPVVLIAAALKVTPEVFRDAFSKVTPNPEHADRNKVILMTALRPYGITNDRLDEVSNYYRYSRANGDLLWRNTPATAYATIVEGAIAGFVITDPGAGYTTPPTPSLPGVTATLAFSPNLKTNGSVSLLTH